ncbi:hypothetical protein HN873_014891, partial [Arachis hypogaea]
ESDNDRGREVLTGGDTAKIIPNNSAYRQRGRKGSNGDDGGDKTVGKDTERARIEETTMVTELPHNGNEAFYEGDTAS